MKEEDLGLAPFFELTFKQIVTARAYWTKSQCEKFIFCLSAQPKRMKSWRTSERPPLFTTIVGRLCIAALRPSATMKSSGDIANHYRRHQ
jgi:hypothetical protein